MVETNNKLVPKTLGQNHTSSDWLCGVRPLQAHTEFIDSRNHTSLGVDLRWYKVYVLVVKYIRFVPKVFRWQAR